MKIALLEKLTQTPRIETSTEGLLTRAASLGGLRIWQYRKDHDFQVSIVFTRSSGSEIEAKGRHSQLAFALKDAIDEAVALGAER